MRDISYSGWEPAPSMLTGKTSYSSATVKICAAWGFPRFTRNTALLAPETAAFQSGTTWRFSGVPAKPDLDSATLQPDPATVAADRVAGLLDAQLAIMAQAVQAAQLAQQVAHARFRRHARAIGVQPPAQHLRLPRWRQLAPRAQRKLAPSGPAPARRNPRAPLRPGSTRPRPCGAHAAPRCRASRASARPAPAPATRAAPRGCNGDRNWSGPAPRASRWPPRRRRRLWDVIAVLVQPGPQVVHLVTARQRRHGGHARQPGAAQQAQQHGLGLIAPVMRQQHQRRAVFAGQPGQRAVARIARRRLDACRRLRPRSRAPRAPAGPAAGPAPASVHSRHRRRPASRDAHGTAAGRCPAPGRWRPHAAPAWPIGAAADGHGHARRARGQAGQRLSQRLGQGRGKHMGMAPAGAPEGMASGAVGVFMAERGAWTSAAAPATRPAPARIRRALPGRRRRTASAGCAAPRAARASCPAAGAGRRPARGAAGGP